MNETAEYIGEIMEKSFIGRTRQNILGRPFELNGLSENMKPCLRRQNGDQQNGEVHDLCYRSVSS